MVKINFNVSLSENVVGLGYLIRDYQGVALYAGLARSYAILFQKLNYRPLGRVYLLPLISLGLRGFASKGLINSD